MKTALIILLVAIIGFNIKLFREAGTVSVLTLAIGLVAGIYLIVLVRRNIDRPR